MFNSFFCSQGEHFILSPFLLLRSAWNSELANLPSKEKIFRPMVLIFLFLSLDPIKFSRRKKNILFPLISPFLLLLRPGWNSRLANLPSKENLFHSYFCSMQVDFTTHGLDFFYSLLWIHHSSSVLTSFQFILVENNTQLYMFLICLFIHILILYIILHYLAILRTRCAPYEILWVTEGSEDVDLYL